MIEVRSQVIILTEMVYLSSISKHMQFVFKQFYTDAQLFPITWAHVGQLDCHIQLTFTFLSAFVCAFYFHLSVQVQILFEFNDYESQLIYHLLLLLHFAFCIALTVFVVLFNAVMEKMEL